MEHGRVLTWLLTVVMIFAAVTASVDDLNVSPWARWTLGILSFACFIAYIWWRHRLDSDITDLGPPIPELVSLEEVQLSASYVMSHHDADAIQYLTDALTNLPAYLTRVNEQMELSGRSILSRTSLVFSGFARVPEGVDSSVATPPVVGSRGQRVLIPLISARKGRLFHKSTAWDASGATLSPLSQRETRGLIFVVVRSMLERAIKEGGPSLTELEEIKLIRIMRQTVFRVGKLDGSSNKQARHSSIEELRRFGDRFDPKWRAKAAELCDSLVSNYVIVVDIERPTVDSVTLGYDHILPSVQDNLRQSEITRAKHGLSAHVMDITMTWPLQAESFHFQFTAPAGTYIFSHHLEEVRTNTIVEQSQMLRQGVQQYARIARNRSENIAHLYIRRQRPDPPPNHSDDSSHDRKPVRRDLEDIKSVVKLREIPPGSLGNATTIALVTAIILVYFTLFRVGLDPSLDKEGANTNQDVPALILTFPAFLAAVLGRGMNQETLGKSTVSAFYGLWLSVFLGLMGVLLYLYGANRKMPLDVELTVFGIKQHYSLPWLAISFLAVGNYLILRKYKSERRRHYLDSLRRLVS
ncbi:hypothetical protein IOD16_04685 [Saccharothrix sp. 6-C]|uniref:hypothetical protein n=1 Tax=Saccharothrix sp. 6-C TaxID=2781735 RepID=UPI0019175904|nr:hypothetical protein [Saccharothrix sp. 6-C]QQQ77799.1 hypothetical protein IOD16_04685 [Saccharothrix sp. 6-C]